MKTLPTGSLISLLTLRVRVGVCAGMKSRLRSLRREWNRGRGLSSRPGRRAQRLIGEAPAIDWDTRRVSGPVARKVASPHQTPRRCVREVGRLLGILRPSAQRRGRVPPPSSWAVGSFALLCDFPPSARRHAGDRASSLGPSLPRVT